MRYLFLIWVAFFYFQGYSQLTIQENVAIQDLVQTLVGPGIEVSNITFNGQVANSTLASSFTDVAGGNNNGFGIEEGIVLSTLAGNLVTRSGTNVLVTEYYPLEQSTPYPAGAEPDLEAVVGGANTILNDAAILEFDFVPTGNEIEVKFVFASDEYNDFVCSEFNDAFGFFLSGPGINGPYSNNAENIALVPGTNIEIAINTVNNGTSATGNNDGCDLPGGGSGLDNAQFFTTNLPANTSVSDMLFQGFTVPILAKSQVQCGKKYHIKLAIADVGDGAMNSAIFLEKESLKSEEEELLAAIVGGNADGATEGCENVSLVLERKDSTKELTIFLEVVGGTAENEVDYTGIPDKVVIPVGETIATVAIDILVDNIAEGIENALIRAYFSMSPCEVIVFQDTVEFKIQDLAPLVLEDKETCLGGAVKLSAGGVGDTYKWTPADGLDNPDIAEPTANPDKTTVYTVTITNTDGSCPRSGEVTVSITEIKADAGPDLSICKGGSVQLTGQGGETYLWEPATGLDDPEIANPVSSTTETLTYTLTVTDISGTCTATDEVTVTVAEMVVNAGNDITICAGDTTTLTATGAGSTYAWLPNDFLATPDQVSTLSYPTRNITYTVTASDISGKCTATDEVVITIEEIIPDFEVEPVCVGSISQFNNLTPVGNFQNIKWNWDFGDTNISDQKSPEHVYLKDSVYLAKLEVVAGSCSGLVEKEVTVHAKPQAKFEVTPQVLDAENPVVECIDLSTLGNTGIWDFGDGVKETYVSGEIKNHTYPILDEAKNYSIKLFVESENGCKDSTVVGIETKSNWAIYFPNSFTPNNDGVNDTFKPNGFGITGFEMRIYNRWGEVVFKTNDLANGWNGQIKDREVNQAVYVWSAQVQNNQGKTKKYIGHVNLLK